MTTAAAGDDAGFVVVEGPMGVGKTDLAQRLASTFGCGLLLDPARDNPFLDRFNADRRANALPTQLHFLLHRTERLATLRQQDLFAGGHCADFLLDKDPVFAELLLDAAELDIYERVRAQLVVDAPVPDLVIYLQAPTPVLLARLQARDPDTALDRAYLESMVDAYTRFFHYYDAAPVLIVNAAEIDLASDDAQYQRLVEVIRRPHDLRSYFNPHPTLI